MYFVICSVPPFTIVAHMHFSPASFMKAICCWDPWSACISVARKVNPTDCTGPNFRRPMKIIIVVTKRTSRATSEYTRRPPTALRIPEPAHHPVVVVIELRCRISVTLITIMYYYRVQRCTEVRPVVATTVLCCTPALPVGINPV